MRDKCHLFFETLGTGLKIDLIFQLKKRPLSVKQLSENLKEERSKVSHALISLLECGLVRVKKEGKSRIYFLNKDTILPLLNLVEKHIKKYCKICKK
ncbi:MAG: helix-turn-helix transcriptional regulator [Candidatus Nealsonbacteria bacterium]|nr:helix-turn-helix transcriptional regulator [Candidatus Nealsonbacteria bacterium]